MPEQKGKKRKKPRNRARLVDRSGIEEPESTQATTSARPVRNPFMQSNPTINGILGVFMLVAGVVFFVFFHQGMDLTARVILLIAYLAMAAFYFFRAYRGHRSRAAGG